MHVVVVFGGDADADYLREKIANAELVVAADGGAAHIREAGGGCDLIVGDLDSLDPADLAEARAVGTEVMQFPIAKDATDGELAILEATRRGATSITVLGALGGPRTDHLLANVALLAHPTLADVKIKIEDSRQRMWLVKASSSWTGDAGDLVTLLAVAGNAQSVTTHGLRYRLTEATLLHGPSLGVSNEMMGSEASIDVANGSVLVIHQRRSLATF
jgi:thiamine pyrophosphokinase